MKIIFYFFIFLFFIASCKKENMCDCFKGTGKMVTESRTTYEFNYIKLHDNIDLVITQDTINKITVEGGDKLLSNLQTKFENDTLVIKNNNKCNWVRNYKKKFTVNLSVKKLRQIKYFGAGNITSTNTIITDTLIIHFINASGKVDISVNANNTLFCMHTGPGELYVKGKAYNNCLYYINNGFAHLENFHTTISRVVNRGTGDCYVNVDDALDVEIAYIGNVYYYGNPSIKTNITNKGKLIKL